MSKLRYLAPNAITLGAMACGLGGMVLAHRGAYVDAGWLLLLATFLDRADGLVARRLRATSAFGVQMDSFADFFNFGVAPAFLLVTALTTTPGLPFGTGSGLAWAVGAGLLGEDVEAREADRRAGQPQARGGDEPGEPMA